MSVFLQETLLLSPVGRPLNHARIGYQNHGLTAAWSSAATFTGSSPNALNNEMTVRRWKSFAGNNSINADLGSPKAVNYVGLAAHNLTGVTLTLQSSDNNSDWTTQIDLVPGSNEAIMMLFETVTARYWRLFYQSGSILPEIGVFYIGTVLEMQRSIYGGFSPINLSRVTTTIPRKSESGQFLTLSRIRRGYEGGATWRHLTADWYRENFDPFVEEATTRPFFLAWNPQKFPEEVVFCWTTDDVRPVNMGIRNLMEVSLNVGAFRE